MPCPSRIVSRGGSWPEHGWVGIRAAGVGGTGGHARVLESTEDLSQNLSTLPLIISSFSLINKSQQGRGVSSVAF